MEVNGSGGGRPRVRLARRVRGLVDVVALTRDTVERAKLGFSVVSCFGLCVVGLVGLGGSYQLPPIFSSSNTTASRTGTERTSCKLINLNTNTRQSRELRAQRAWYRITLSTYSHNHVDLNSQIARSAGATGTGGGQPSRTMHDAQTTVSATPHTHTHVQRVSQQLSRFSHGFSTRTPIGAAPSASRGSWAGR